MLCHKQEEHMYIFFSWCTKCNKFRNWRYCDQAEKAKPLESSLPSS